MSEDQAQASGAYGALSGADYRTPKKGSVRAARERLQAAQKRSQLPDTSKIIGLPSRSNQPALQPPAQNEPEQLQQLTSSRYREDENMDSPPPQWPLPNEAIDLIRSSPVISPPSPSRFQPPRPSIRPVSDDYPIQQLSPEYMPNSPDYLQPPSIPYGGGYQNYDAFSPVSRRSSRPLTTSSFASETSSLGDIPDFPVPQPPMPTVQPMARRTPGLGPPPSSRRGPLTYYTQMSYVSPIREESETRSNTIRSQHGSFSRRGSFASSNVFPSNSNDFYPDDYPLSDYDETMSSDPGTLSPISDHGDQRDLVKQPPVLVRQASLGRRSKPSLLTIKSSDGLGDKSNGVGGRGQETLGKGTFAAGADSGSLPLRDMMQRKASPGPRSSILSTGTGLMSPSTSSSESDSVFRSMKLRALNPEDPDSPLYPFEQEPRSTNSAGRMGKRRPPTLDVDAVRTAEARGSLTSLPDLIKRATRLAANLDRGRTASRLGLDFWEIGGPEKKNARQSGLSDMLAAFPSPGQDTPLRSGTPAGPSTPNDINRFRKNSANGAADVGRSDEKPNRRRKCCGIPMWTFVTLLIVLLFVIAAAVIIPIVLVVIPNASDNKNKAADNNQANIGNTNTPILPAPTASPGTGQCDGVISCQNNGVAILNADRTCNCVCINGFTGSTCTKMDETGCTTTHVEGTANNATLGSAIPRLLESAVHDFNIALNSTRILSLFSSLGLSCASENALITFNGLASRSAPQNKVPDDMDISALLTKSLHVHTQSHMLRRPQVVKRQTAQPTATTQPISSNVTSLDYARTSVLLVLQLSGELNAAASAQEAIQQFLRNDQSSKAEDSTVDVGLFKIDLANLTIKFTNGTTIGATQSTPRPSSTPYLSSSPPSPTVTVLAS